MMSAKKPATVGVKKTGYSVYNEEQRRRRLAQPLPDSYPSMPVKKYDVIYCDPPWDYNGKMQFDKSSTAQELQDLDRPIFISSAEFKYPTLKLEQLIQIRVQDICQDDCLLFMWTSSPHLTQAISLGEAWGFAYRTVAFVWDKLSHNPGVYTLSNCELCLVFKRGRIPRPRGARNVQQLVRARRGRHSQKPQEVRQSLSRMWPTQDKIELFARGKFEGWDVWGLEAADLPEFALTPVEHRELSLI
jgi:N6-adenosine-specific RNA methylase IME4